MIKIKKTEDAKDLPLPSYQTELASGMDLYANVTGEYVLPARSFGTVNTGVCIDISPDCEAQIRGRSGLARKFGIGLVNGIGTIDADYRGEIAVVFMNNSDNDFVIRRGDRIAQMVITKIERIEIVEVSELSDTARGDGGFGSTGV